MVHVIVIVAGAIITLTTPLTCSMHSGRPFACHSVYLASWFYARNKRLTALSQLILTLTTLRQREWLQPLPVCHAMFPTRLWRGRGLR